MSQPIVVTHPLAQIHLTGLRRDDTPADKFRWHLQRLAEILFTVGQPGAGNVTDNHSHPAC